MHTQLLKIGLVIYILLSQQANAQGPYHTAAEPDSFFRQYRLAESHTAYLRIATDASLEISVRSAAYQQLAAQDIKFYRDNALALQMLGQALALKTDSGKIKTTESAIYLASAHYPEALASANESLLLAQNKIEHTASEIAFARTIYELAFYQQGRGIRFNIPALQKAARLLGKILEEQPGNPDASELLTGISIFLKDGTGVLKGWKSYYLVDKEENINGELMPGFRHLKKILEAWHGNILPASQMKTLATGFMETRFFNYARLIADEIRKIDAALYNQSHDLKDITAYQSYIEDVQKVNDAIYPKVALGKTKYEDEYDSLMNTAGKKLWSRLSFTNHTSKFDADTFYQVMNRHFGMEGYSGTTVNYYGMLMGHIIHREIKQIDQYGYHTNFTYISVDRLISRDFTSWYGTTNVGGWGDSATIIQVRKAYMTEPFELLNWMTDSTEQAKVLADIRTRKQADDALCRNDPYAEPTFLAKSLKFNEASKIYKNLTKSGLHGTALSIAFIDEIFRLTIASTVFAHEGRHAIDQRYFPEEFKTMTDDERELRAKFSEVIFSLDPKMAFTGSILGSNLGDNTNHGKANKRFRKIIADWMKTHASDINGLNENAPMLMQFDLLTDEQLVQICKSADPMAHMISK